MYTLYFVPDACSLATQVVLRELGQNVELIHKQQVADFSQVNPVGVVPVLHDRDQPEGAQLLREGAAIMLHILEKHQSHLLPAAGSERQQAIRNIMFANASMHPAYSRLFFAAANMADDDTRRAFFAAATNSINALWRVVEQQLQQQPFLGGNQVSAADIMLTVYSRWGAAFPVDIVIGEKTRAMISNVMAMDSFRAALAAEQDAQQQLQ
ncbi:glutathione S-transferase family protein [Thalassolituus sp. LLYu03]|uniref:glutathione S-transferase family protein n=1 Tax=Thalassolituus sp. LLYu03 TaxID=3421656 RepID=UPI003D2759C8